MRRKWIWALASWLLLWGSDAEAGDVRLLGRVVDGQSGDGLKGAAVALYRAGEDAPFSGTLSDSSGGFLFAGLEEGRWRLEVTSMGFARERREVRLQAGETRIEIPLQVQPLLMDELLVRARRQNGKEVSPTFVETIPVMEGGPSLSLPEVLEQAVGVKIRRQGGMGSFSTVSIRGSTAEQVQVFLDGIPLNQALGGGVNLGDLPVSGVESVEVYRGAVPVRFGGNSIGGVVHIRTRDPGEVRQVQLQGKAGSFGTRQVSGSATGAWRDVRYLGLMEYAASRNDFRFWDDNGTEYNAADDEWAARVNSDFLSFRGLGKLGWEWGETRLQVHNSFDLKHQGIPGIGNYQADRVRSDLWRNATEMEVFGMLSRAGYAGYRLGAYHLFEEDEYKDPDGEVGTGTQHDRNATRGMGLRGELSALLPGGLLVTGSGGVRQESFSPKNLLQRDSRLLKSRRRSARLGLEGELSFWDDCLQLLGGSSLEVNGDRFFDQKDFAPSELLPSRENTEQLWGRHVGGRANLGDAWSLKGHWGKYQRAPSFYELFGDRGAVIGNTELESEKGTNQDLGLVYGRSAPRVWGPQLAELIFYRNSSRDMIRFVQNSQRVSQPQNIGKARIQGIETRGLLRLGFYRVSASYVYQRAEDRSPFSYHRGNELPNAPRHVFHLRNAVEGKRGGIYYELNRESRHFLDRANRRPVARRLIHSLGGQVRLTGKAEVAWEIRNLTGNQVADLWGYPLPGRSFFVSLKQNLSFRPSTHSSEGEEEK